MADPSRTIAVLDGYKRTAYQNMENIYYSRITATYFIEIMEEFLMKSLISAICSLVVFVSMASMIEACDDMPLFTVYSVNGDQFIDSDKFYYSPDRRVFIVTPLYGGKNMVFKDSDITMACCDGEFEIRGGKLYFHPSYFNALGISITYTMPFDTEKQCFVAERELMDAIATSCKYGTSKEDLSAYFNKHMTIVGIK